MWKLRKYYLPTEEQISSYEKHSKCLKYYTNLRNPVFAIHFATYEELKKVESRHTNFHFSSKKVEVFDKKIVKELSAFLTWQFNAKKLKLELPNFYFSRQDKRKVEKSNDFWQLSGQKLQLFDFSR